MLKTATSPSRLAQRGDDVRSEAGHAERHALDDHHGSVAIDHQPRQPVGLAPHQPPDSDAARGARAARARVDAAGDEGGVDRLVGPGEDAAAERRAGIEQPRAHEASARIARR